ncbi:hypothetical protein HU200_010632 [Digitaria exilis]|uniref:Uncharacterized protein n=1 Tax=Digitaria exilis TaxID=1010633 RepID=A0A835FHM3_9POAL|nr:hypothetical protein HU200_010632 [Digitaria exilis]
MPRKGLISAFHPANPTAVKSGRRGHSPGRGINIVVGLVYSTDDKWAAHFGSPEAALAEPPELETTPPAGRDGRARVGRRELAAACHRNEARLLRGVEEHVQFIKEEMQSMNSFSAAPGPDGTPWRRARRAGPPPRHRLQQLHRQYQSSSNRTTAAAARPLRCHPPSSVPLIHCSEWRSELDVVSRVDLASQHKISGRLHENDDEPKSRLDTLIGEDVRYSSTTQGDKYVYFSSSDIHLGRGGLRRFLLWAPWFLNKTVAQHRAAVELRALKARAREVGERRQRYDVRIPEKHHLQRPGYFGPLHGQRRTPDDAAGVDEEERLRPPECPPHLLGHAGRVAILKPRTLDDYFQSKVPELMARDDSDDTMQTRRPSISHGKPWPVEEGRHTVVVVDIPRVHMTFQPLRPTDILYYILRELQPDMVELDKIKKDIQDKDKHKLLGDVEETQDDCEPDQPKEDCPLVQKPIDELLLLLLLLQSAAPPDQARSKAMRKLATWREPHLPDSSREAQDACRIRSRPQEQDSTHVAGALVVTTTKSTHQAREYCDPKAKEPIEFSPVGLYYDTIPPSAYLFPEPIFSLDSARYYNKPSWLVIHTYSQDPPNLSPPGALQPLREGTTGPASSPAPAVGLHQAARHDGTSSSAALGRGRRRPLAPLCQAPLLSSPSLLCSPSRTTVLIVSASSSSLSLLGVEEIGDGFGRAKELTLSLSLATTSAPPLRSYSIGASASLDLVLLRRHPPLRRLLACSLSLYLSFSYCGRARMLRERRASTRASCHSAAFGALAAVRDDSTPGNVPRCGEKSDIPDCISGLQLIRAAA